MKSLQILTIGLGTILAASATAPAARAGCGAPLKQKISFSTTPSDTAGPIQLASYVPKTIVGLWKVAFLSQGTQIDFGYSTWHSDGTEFLNSGGRAPSTQNYCLGVWKQTGAFSYKLNHWALSYDTSGNYNANVNIKETVKLDHDGNSFGGTFSIQAYDPTSGSPLGSEVDGDITGTRVTVD